MSNKPEIVIDVKPAPMDLVFDEDWHKEAQRLVNLHSSAPELLEMVINLKAWHKTYASPLCEVSQLVDRLTQELIDKVTK